MASIAIPGGSVEVLSEDGVDLEGGRERVERAQRKLREEIQRIEGKLANRGFMDKAPAAVVAAEQAKLERVHSELRAL